jgi:hypothetical protein
MFNLNDASFGGGITVFNNGNAGKVENVTMSVTKKLSTDADNAPDFKLVFTDINGAQINQGFYYHKNNDMNTEQKNKDMEGWLIGRVLSAAKSVVPEDFVFPEVATSKEALDSLFTIIRNNCENKKVNVYVTYGTKTKPSQYLSLRYFNFVEAADTPESKSKLKFSANDELIKLVPDNSKQESNDNSMINSKNTW